MKKKWDGFKSGFPRTGADQKIQEWIFTMIEIGNRYQSSRVVGVVHSFVIFREFFLLMRLKMSQRKGI